MKLDYKRTFLVGLASLTISGFWVVYEAVIPLILRDSFGIGDTISGAVMAADNVLALFMLPFFGALSDRTNTRIGRRMPYIVVGTLASALMALLLPIADNMRSLPFFAAALCGVLLCMSIYRSPAVALMPDVTPAPLRSRGNAVINLMGTVGGIISLGLVAVLVPAENPNYLPLFGCVALMMITALVIMLLTVKEPVLRRRAIEQCRAAGIPMEEEKEQDKGKSGAKLEPAARKSLVFLLMSVFLWFFGYNAVTTAFSKYAQVYWGMEGGSFAYTMIVAQAAAVISFIPMGQLAARIGRKKTIQLGIVLLFTAFASAMFFKTFSPMIIAFFALAGIGWAAINVNSYPMVVEMSRGADIGRYTGFYYTFSMLSQVLTPVVSGAMLQYVGYWTLFPYGALFAALSFVTMLFVRHGDAKPVAKTGVSAFEDMD